MPCRVSLYACAIRLCSCDECVCTNTFPLRTKWKQEGRKGEKKRKEALLWAMLPLFFPYGVGEGEGPARGQGRAKVRLKEVVPSTTTGWHWRPQMALVRSSWWAGTGQA